MPTVTVRQPATVRVRIEGQKSKVQTLSYGTKTLRSLTDLGLTGANTGDVIVYNSETKTFNVKGLGTDTPVHGSLLPTESRTFDLGSRTRKFRSLFLSGNTIDLDGTIIKAEATTGALSFSAAPTAANPNPIALVVSPVGGLTPVQTIQGVIPEDAIQRAVANSITYLAFQGVDMGFF
jgi:hypothetical protein